MSEHEKIKKLVEKVKALLLATDMDVSESIKGHWFFSRYNEEFDYYDVLAQFKTAEELAEIILGELSSDMFTTIDAESNSLDYRNYADDIEMKESYQPYIDRLLEYLGK